LFNNGDLVSFVAYDKFIREIKIMSFFSKDGGAKRVEGSDREMRGGRKFKYFKDAAFHFVGGFVSEGSGEDLPSGDGAFQDEVGDAVSNDASFAGAGAGDNE
jgi:hypothetical protein